MVWRKSQELGVLNNLPNAEAKFEKNVGLEELFSAKGEISTGLSVEVDLNYTDLAEKSLFESSILHRELKNLRKWPYWVSERY